MSVTTMEHQRPVAVWLFACAFLIFCMVVLGGVTRLTESGLSMVHWKPISGVIPPITESEWLAEMAHYKESPEYQKINRGMSLDEFKNIFYFEWAHRVLGRIIGFAFLFPFLWFLLRRNISWRQSPRYIGLFILGGLQGLLGWYMVKSGLVDNPRVSQYRLAAHLMLAVVIYAFILWNAMSLWNPGSTPQNTSNASYKRLTQALTALILLTIFTGALVAGLDAGQIFNTFPKMGSEWIPSGINALQPGYLNLFENLVTVQFNHRYLALFTALCVLLYVFHSRKLLAHGTSSISNSRYAMLLMVLIQVGLGITTLLLNVPVWAGAMHQAGALLLFSTLLWHWHSLQSR